MGTHAWDARRPNTGRFALSRCGRRVALVCAIIGLALTAGCGRMRSKDGAASSKARHPIDRVAQKGPVKLSVSVWPAEPRLSDLVEMDVTVESQPGVEIKPPAFGQGVGDFLIRDYSERPPILVRRTFADSIISWSRLTPAST